MMRPELALLALICLPVVHALLVLACARPPGLRDFVHLLAAFVAAVLAFYLLASVASGEEARVVLARPLPNVDLAFSIEPLGVLFAAIISGLGVLHAAHTAGVVRATHERAPARLMAFLALAAGGACAVALSANLFTLFVSYQALTLAAYPLVAHRGDEGSARAGQIFLAVLLAAAIGLFLPAMVWTYAIAGVLEFQPGGVLAGRVDTLTANVLLLLFFFGMAMSALPPMHRWLTVSAGAPFPALVSIQGLTVLPAGGIGVVKVAAFVFGPAALETAAWSALGLIALAGVGMCVAALTALSHQDLRERLAHSCMAQSLAVIVGALLALPAGLFAAVLQIAALTCSAATLMMATGSIAAITMRTNVADCAGLGRVMPWTLSGFAIASASMIGMPPFAGAWAKLWLIAASAGAGLIWAAVLVGLAAVLTFAHLGPLAASALSDRAPDDAFKRPDGASILLAGPVILGAAATLSLLALADTLANFLSPVWTPPA
jgi:multicomponent Na+:H+ antiporter subunit D